MPAKASCAFILICILTLMLAAVSALSNDMLVGNESKTIPYEDGGGQIIPSAAAGIYEVWCSCACCGYRYDLEIEVFESCWEPIYSIEFEGLEGVIIRAAACPTGWVATQIPRALQVTDRLVFSTETEPILPGMRLKGFSILSDRRTTIIRWYPADEEGILVGKVTREDLSCTTTAREPRLWGSIKAMYR